MSKKMVLGYPSTLGTGSRDSYPFADLFNSVQVTPDDVRAGKCDALILWGGEDISPTIYKTSPSKKAGTFRLTELGHRDSIEVPLFEAAVEMGIPVIGVCRGAQLACAMSGGKLVQHVNGHGGSHPMRLSDGEVITTSSVHHQMMYPFDLPSDKYEVLATSLIPRSNTYIFSDDDVRDEIEDEPEVLYFPETKSLCIQGHPEFCSEHDPFVQYSRELIKKYILTQGA